MDCDNDHSDNPADWVTPEKLAEDPDLSQVGFATTPSRHNMIPKGNRSARPRFHFHAPISVCDNAEEYAAIKSTLHRKYPFFDKNALDSARFMFGSQISEADVFWHEGPRTADEIVVDQDCVPGTYPIEDVIAEGARNNTMYRFACRVLKRYGISDTAYNLFLDRAEKCIPPLSEKELSNIWNHAVKFAQSIQSSPDYIPPEQYSRECDAGRMRPEDYSDLGEAKVLAAECYDRLRYTSGTDFLAYENGCWREDKEKALGVIEEFLDNQLNDANAAIKKAENALIAIGINKKKVRAHDPNLAQDVPQEATKLVSDLYTAISYHKFVMKYRGYRNIVNIMATAKPMVAVDISELDYDSELLNTPAGTYNLSKGLDGCSPHNPDDSITKITNVAPGDRGMELWQDALNLFFCGDTELIEYVQRIVGQAAVGKVYEEHMIIAYGGGANGKSTFWNVLARVLGTYSGMISADTLTVNCKRNVKPEMAEMKGKRLVIASELEEGTRLNTGVVKRLCSTNPVFAEKKYKAPFSFYPSHTLVLYTNHLPKVSTNDDGTWRRLRVVPFNKKITGKSDIKNYADYLFDEAGPAILKWVIEGAKKAIESHFCTEMPKAVLDAIEAYRESNNWLGQFIEEHCDVDVSFSEKSGDLYQAYRNTCMMSGEYIHSTSDFYGNLEQAGFVRRRTNAGRMIMGLKLKDGQDFLD